MNLLNSQGRPVVLGSAVGHGGEATVYEVVGQPDRLAKIYDPEPRPDYSQKLVWMVAHPPDNPTSNLQHDSLAWPDCLLYDPQRLLKGFCMPHITQAVPLLDVFNPRRRALVMPQFDRRYLHRTASNLAAAFSALHRSGYVAGDVNESNVLVTPTALVTLIDTDSFQVREKRRGKDIVYPCPVGKPEYTPPELQGTNLSQATRLPDHDSFGLAVLIFQLLMNGSHPFRAQWLGRGDPPPIEKRIADGAFPYAPGLTQPIAPPINALSLDTLHPDLAELFRRCFIDGHRSPHWRPGPDLWVQGLNRAEASLVCCSEGHFYSSHISGCPYCVMSEKRSAPPAARKAASEPGVQQPARKPPRPVRVQTPPGPRPRPVAARPAVGKNTGSVLPQSLAFQSAAPGRASGGNPGTAPSVGSGSPVSGWPGPVVGAAAGASGSPSVASGGVLRGSSPPAPHVPPGVWLRKWITNSIMFGGGQGAGAGSIPGALIALACWFGAVPLNWSLLLALSGSAGALVRGWQPGYRLARAIDRYIGWRHFWQGVGLLFGAVGGSLLGILVNWAIVPVIIGLVFGARLGLEFGKRFWMLGSRVGWERIWGAISALAAAAAGWGVAHVAGVVGLNTFGAELAVGLMPYSLDRTASAALLWLLAGGVSGAIFGALSGLLIDLFARLVRIVR